MSWLVQSLSNIKNATCHLDGAEPVYRCTRVPQPKKTHKTHFPKIYYPTCIVLIFASTAHTKCIKS